MKYIKLTQGKYAAVDDEDYSHINQWKWCLMRTKTKCYAVRAKNKRLVLMHRVILLPPEGVAVDHRDGNGINNTRGNLRQCTTSQNAMNQKGHSDSMSGYKGVTWHNIGNSWQAAIMLNGRHIHIGLFFCLIKAAKAYDKKAKELHGEFANLNFKGEKNESNRTA